MRWLLAVALLATQARAEPTPQEAALATDLFEQGHRLIDAGDVDGACQKFEASLHLDAKLGTRLNLADCRERQGRLVEAYALFDDAATEAARTTKQGRETFAREHLASLATRLVRVTVRVAGAGVAVRLGERELPPAAWDKPQVVEPGAIVVVATSPGKKPLRIVRAAAAGAEVAIDVPVLEAESPPPVVEMPRRSHVPFVVVAGGGALLATSAVLGLHAKIRYNSAASAGDEAKVKSTQREANVATGFLIAGAVAAGVGVALYVKQDRLVVTPTTDGTGVGIAVSGRL